MSSLKLNYLSICLGSLIVVFFSLVLFRPTSLNNNYELHKSFVSISKLPGIAVSASHLEARHYLYQDSSNDIYFNASRHGYLEFVYAD